MNKIFNTWGLTGKDWVSQYIWNSR